MKHFNLDQIVNIQVLLYNSRNREVSTTAIPCESKNNVAITSQVSEDEHEAQLKKKNHPKIQHQSFKHLSLQLLTI